MLLCIIPIFIIPIFTGVKEIGVGLTTLEGPLHSQIHKAVILPTL